MTRIKGLLGWSILGSVILTLLTSGWAHANDSAVEIAAGGLKLRKEHRVTMQTEKLFISPDLVTVEYEFLNTAKVAVTSEVAFPISPVQLTDYCEKSPSDFRFASFRAWVDDKPIKVKKEVRAFAKGKEVTAELRGARVDIEMFGGPDCDGDITDNEMARLKPKVRERLIKTGAAKPEGTQEDGGPGVVPVWEARIAYHWKQIFPPGVLVRVRHEYEPVIGGAQLGPKDFMRTCVDACAPKEMKDHVALMKEHALIPTLWVGYILTTANSWKTPIRDFQLVVRGRNDETVTLCWDGPVEKRGEGELRVHEVNFVPKKDLRAYFVRRFKE